MANGWSGEKHLEEDLSFQKRLIGRLRHDWTLLLLAALIALLAVVEGANALAAIGLWLIFGIAILARPPLTGGCAGLRQDARDT